MAMNPTTWKGRSMSKATTKKAKRAAKKLFKKQPHSTRPFTMADYDALPKGNNQ